ncbi:MAG: hypothetical protein ABSA21_11775 [Candidatus Limnocylindrales bacterium]|jgi:hypothetical protein
MDTCRQASYGTRADGQRAARCLNCAAPLVTLADDGEPLLPAELGPVKAHEGLRTFGLPARVRLRGKSPAHRDGPRRVNLWNDAAPIRWVGGYSEVVIYCRDCGTRHHVQLGRLAVA